MPVNYRR